MSIITLEGIIEKGRLRLLSDVRLPDRMPVTIVIPHNSPNLRWR